eukprot:scaffold22653_cov53-Attheya_sp.AAC.2
MGPLVTGTTYVAYRRLLVPIPIAAQRLCGCRCVAVTLAVTLRTRERHWHAHNRRCARRIRLKLMGSLYSSHDQDIHDRYRNIPEASYSLGGLAGVDLDDNNSRGKCE